MTPALHQHLIVAIEDIRSRFAQANLPDFSFTISASGRTHGKPEVKIEYKIGQLWGTGASGGSFDATLNEALRRNGWDKENAPVSLPAPDQTDQSNQYPVEVGRAQALPPAGPSVWRSLTMTGTRSKPMTDYRVSQPEAPVDPRRRTRFGIEIRGACNQLIKSESGYPSREDAERVAAGHRRHIENKGWRASVYVTEQHQVQRGT
jgi:hypothetical protein